MKSIITRLAGCILLVAWAGLRLDAQVNFQGWTFRAAGQTVQLGANGSIRIPNLSAPDQFGEGGPGTIPDFKSDDFVRVIGKSNDEGVPMYAFSEFFRVEQGKDYTIKNWTFTSLPPPQPQSIRAFLDKPALTELKATAQMKVLGLLGDETTADLTPKEQWTTYRSSSPGVALVDPDGKVTAVSAGTAFITAVNEGAATVVQLDVVPGGQLTTISGMVVNKEGAPVSGVIATVVGAAGNATTKADGTFSIVGVAAQKRISGIIVRGRVGTNTIFGKSGSIEVQPNGLTDAGVVTVKTCEELGIDCQDTDDDCIPDSVERASGGRLNFQSPDTDNDGLPDGEEDTDGDGFANCQEILQGTSPLSTDTDRDGLPDRDEILRYFTDPAVADTDRDGMGDGDEVSRATDPFNPDTDGDGFDDGTEVSERMDPLVADLPLIRSIASRPVTYLAAAARDSLPIEVAVHIQSRPASFWNLQPISRPSSVPVSVGSEVASYLNAVPVARVSEVTNRSSSALVSFLRNLPVSASVTSPGSASPSVEGAGDPLKLTPSKISKSETK